MSWFGRVSARVVDAMTRNELGFFYSQRLKVAFRQDDRTPDEARPTREESAPYDKRNIRGYIGQQHESPSEGRGADKAKH